MVVSFGSFSVGKLKRTRLDQLLNTFLELTKNAQNHFSFKELFYGLMVAVLAYYGYHYTIPLKVVLW